MWESMKVRWDNCAIRHEDKNCDYWPEDCELCPLVQYYLIKLPKCWRAMDMNSDCEDDRKQLSMLIHSHITGNCGGYCLFCEVERIPI